MPMIDITLSEGALTDEARREVVDRLTTRILEHESVPDNHMSRLFSWCFVHEVPAEGVNIGGARSSKPIYRVVVAVPHSTAIHGHGPEASARRRRIARDVTEIVLEAEGTEFGPGEAWRVWVIIHEVADNFWSMAGNLFRFEDLVTMMAPDEKDRTKVGNRLREAADAAVASDTLAAAGD